LNQICYFEIPADVLDRAEKFYHQLFGWTFYEMTLGSTPYRTIKTPEGIQGGLEGRHGSQQGWMSYVEVESVSGYLERAVSLGGKVVVEKRAVPGLGYFALIEDTENNVFGLWETDANAD